jgi:gliding motility-associated peptidyl-prolyl isomerase
MKNKWIVFLGLVFVIVACSKLEARRPKSHSSSKKVTETIEWYSKMVAHENTLIENFIKSDSMQVYQNSQKGFWYRYLTKKDKGVSPVKGDKVLFEQAIFSLSGELLYSAEELGVQEYFIDKEYVIKGVREGIKLMKEGEDMLFVLPSFVAYRSKGDDKKRIASNETILTRIKLINIKKKNNEN